MRKRASVLDDPVVAEVRAVRAKLWKEGGGTVSGYLELIRKLAGNGSKVRKPVGRRGRKQGTQGRRQKAGATRHKAAGRNKDSGGRSRTRRAIPNSVS